MTTSPLRFDQSLPLKIDRIVTENVRVKSFYFKHKMIAEPGQFAMIWVPGYDEKPFGIVVVDEETFLISVAAVGESTKALHQMKPGDTIGFRGPYGNWFHLPEQPSRIALIAGGYGMAPLGYFAKMAAEKGYTVDVFAGARSHDQFLIYPFLDHPNIAIYKATNDGTAGYKGLVTDAFKEYLEQQTPAFIYTVGPEPMEQLVAEICYTKNLPFEVSLERYMKCGFGICGQCCVDPTGWRMCIEGPVLNHGQLRQVTEFGKYHRSASGKIIPY